MQLGLSRVDGSGTNDGLMQQAQQMQQISNYTAKDLSDVPITQSIGNPGSPEQNYNHNQIYNQVNSQMTQPQMSNQMNGQMNNQMNSQINGQMNNQTSGQMNNQMNNQMHGQMNNQMNNQMHGQMNGQMNNQMNGQMNNQMNNQMNGQMNGQMMNPQSSYPIMDPITQSQMISQDPLMNYQGYDSMMQRQMGGYQMMGSQMNGTTGSGPFGSVSGRNAAYNPGSQITGSPYSSHTSMNNYYTRPVAPLNYSPYLNQNLIPRDLSYDFSEPIYHDKKSFVDKFFGIKLGESTDASLREITKRIFKYLLICIVLSLMIYLIAKNKIIPSDIVKVVLIAVVVLAISDYMMPTICVN
jgi:hypothetical protein